jgi:hypothetical protein
MNKPLFVSIAILFVTTVCLGIGTFMVHDAEQKEGRAGFVRVSPVINEVAVQNVSQTPVCNAPVVRCNEDRCVVQYGTATYDSCQTTTSKYLKDTLLVSNIILSQSPESNPDLSWMQMQYFSASNGTEMILAQNQMIGIYLIEKKSESEMLFMNFFDKSVEVKLTGEIHNGMPVLYSTNFDMSAGVYKWDGTGYKLDHEERWNCPA